ncbi:MAG: hypothetical protein L6R37_005396 [Teloschistes peruensis]|nr:MAG: hypothetical protein L6R37_005396 [Teloschistes peruensis]
MSTASKWFVPDAEFFASTEDYALVGQPENMIHPLVGHYEEDFLEQYFFHNEDEEAQEHENITVAKEFSQSRSFGDIFGLGHSQQLLYADVDCSDPEHKTIRRRVAVEGCLKEESQKSKEAREKLIEHLVIANLSHLSVEEVGECTAEEREDPIQLLEDSPGMVSRKTVDYILSLEDKGERRETLNVLSGQHLRKIQRSVLLLIGMVEKHSMEEVETNEGWAIAYNFYEDRLIIKPFFSDKAHHPLAEKWDTDLPDDGISFSGRPSGIVERFWKIHGDIQKKEQEKDTTAFSYRVLVTLFTMRWIREHWQTLCAIKYAEGDNSPTLSKDEKPKVKEAVMTILEAMDKVKLDRKTRKPDEEDAFGVFKHMQGLLEINEPPIRRDVVKVKEAGREVAAQNAAKLYGRLLEQLRSFNLDPEKEI